MSSFQSAVENVHQSSEQFSVSILWQIIIIIVYSAAFEQYALLIPWSSFYGWEVEMVSALVQIIRQEFYLPRRKWRLQNFSRKLSEYSWSGWLWNMSVLSFLLRFLGYDHLAENCLIMSIKNKVWILGHLSRHFSKGPEIIELGTIT